VVLAVENKPKANIRNLQIKNGDALAPPFFMGCFYGLFLWAK
jgi:hypothetical protein